MLLAVDTALRVRVSESANIKMKLL